MQTWIRGLLQNSSMTTMTFCFPLLLCLKMLKQISAKMLLFFPLKLQKFQQE